MPQGWDLRGYRGWGEGHFFFQEFNQILCVSYSHEWHMQRHNFLVLVLGPLGGPKGQVSLNFNIFKPNFVCLQMGFLFSRLGHATGVGLRGYNGEGEGGTTGGGGGGGGGGVKNFFFRNSTKFGV